VKRISRIVIALLMGCLQLVCAYDQQYSSQYGLSGAIFTPSPYVYALEEGSSVYSINFYQKQDPSTFIQDRAARHLSFFGAGVSRNLEISFGQELFTGAEKRRRSYIFGAKYSMPNDSLPMSLSVINPTRSEDWASIIMSAGWRQFYFGIGTNVGGRELKEVDVLAGRDVGNAQYGGYRMFRRLANQNVQQSRLEVVGRPDEIYFIAGGTVDLSKNFQWLYDYNGDLFSTGLRLSFDTLSFQVNWVSSGDYDTLFLRDQDNFTVSAQYRW